MLGDMPGYLADARCFDVKLVSLMPRNEPGPIFLASRSSCFSVEQPPRGHPRCGRDHRHPHGRRERARDASARAAGRRRSRHPPGAGSRRAAVEAMLAVEPLRRIRVWARDRAKAEVFAGTEGAAWSGNRDGRQRAGGVAGADIICAHQGARADSVGRLDFAQRASQVSRVAEAIAAAAEIDGGGDAIALLCRLRRNSTINGREYLRALPLRAPIGRAHRGRDRRRWQWHIRTHLA